MADLLRWDPDQLAHTTLAHVTRMGAMEVVGDAPADPVENRARRSEPAASIVISAMTATTRIAARQPCESISADDRSSSA